MAEDHVLGRTSLMSGHYVFKTGDAGDSVFHSVERSCSGIAFVAGHHGGPLPVAHRSCAGVREQIYIYLFGPQLEDVVVGVAQPLEAFFFS